MYDFLNYKLDFGKHNSSYFNVPAWVVVVIAFLLPGIVGSININLAFFGSLILLLVALFEKRSIMVRFYCLQYCFTSIFFNIFLTLVGLLANIIPSINILVAFITLFISTFMLFVFFYSIVQAFRYKGWFVPYVGDLVLYKVLKYRG